MAPRTRTPIGTPTATPTVTDLFDLEDCAAGVVDGSGGRVDELAEEAEAAAGATDDVDGEGVDELGVGELRVDEMREDEMRVDELREEVLREEMLELLEELNVGAPVVIPTVMNGTALPGRLIVCFGSLQLQAPQQYLLSSQLVRESRPTSEAID